MPARFNVTLGLCALALSCRSSEVAESSARAAPATVVATGAVTRPAAAAPAVSEMVTVPAGPFMMGSTTSDLNDALPLHQVTLSAYSIDVHTVTNGEYLECETAAACTAPGSPSSFTRTNYHTDPKYAAFPVVYVSWAQAKVYCTWAGKRLPTEAEWEKAARGGSDQRTYPWGEAAPTCAVANFFPLTSYCIGDTDAVGARPAGDSPYGVHDMAGNVLEWVADWYDAAYYSKCSSGCTNPQGPATGVQRVLRSSAWFMDAPHLRLAIRASENPASQVDFFGFRCAK